MDHFSFAHTKDHDQAMLSVTGELDVAAKDALTHHLRRVIHDAHSPALVDLSGVTFMDASCVSVLTAASRGAREAGAELVLIASAPSVLRVLKLTGVDQIIEHRATV